MQLCSSDPNPEAEGTVRWKASEPGITEIQEQKGRAEGGWWPDKAEDSASRALCPGLLNAPLTEAGDEIQM